MGWDQLKKARQTGGSGSFFISLKDGETVQGVFRGEPYGYYRKFPDKTEYADWADGRRFRFKVNFVVKEKDEYVAKIFEGSKTVSEQLLDVIEEYSQDAVFKIKRAGTTKDDTRYTIMHVRKLSDDDKAALDNVKLKDLKGGRSRKDEKETPEVEEEIPF